MGKSQALEPHTHPDRIRHGLFDAVRVLCTLGIGLKVTIELLKTLPRVAAVPHNDEAGWEAIARWREALPDLLIIPLPDRFKDVQEMAQGLDAAQQVFDSLLPRHTQ